jgi:hypothetical protein
MNSSSALGSLCIVASLFAPQASLSQSRSYVSAKFNYRLLLPPGWNMSAAGSDVLMIFDYKQTEALPQGLFPDRGAEIWVIPFAGLEAITKAKTMDEWIAYNAGHNHSGVSTKHRPDLSKGGNSPNEVVEVDADFERDPQDEGLQHEVNYYFTLRGKMFRLMLIYWKGNPQASHLRSVCESLLGSVRAQ